MRPIGWASVPDFLLMPYCSNCNHWSRYPEKAGLCRSCGEFSFTNSPVNPVSAEAQLLFIAAGVCFFGGVFLTPLLTPLSFIVGFLLALVCSFWAMYHMEDRVKIRRKHVEAHGEFPTVVFSRIKESLEKHSSQAQEIRKLLQVEGSGPHSERALHRVELLWEALVQREIKIKELQTDLWCREVQIWLNQLEGFLAAELPGLKLENAEQVHVKFEKVGNEGRLLLQRGASLESDQLMPQRAWRVLEECMGRMPELQDRVRDARALAVLGDSCDSPRELEADGSWLHWLQEAIPTIELLPPEFSEDEEFLRVQTQLRLLRDGVKFPESKRMEPRVSLDRGDDWTNTNGGEKY